MQITRQADYAIRCILYLSQHHGEVKVVDEIARAKYIPKVFLAKILQKLSKAGIVKSYRGVKGGFELARMPRNISLLDVIEAIEGPVAMNRCAINKRMCNLSDECSIHPVWVELRKEIEKRLEKRNFKTLLTQEKRKRRKKWRR